MALPELQRVGMLQSDVGRPFDGRNAVAFAMDCQSSDQFMQIIDRHELLRYTHQPNVFLKIGLELFTAAGPTIVRRARELGFLVFLDLKLHDTPRTVAGAVRSAAGLGCSLLTLHASNSREALDAAAKARDAAGTHDFALLGVSVLTSLNDQDVAEVYGDATPANVGVKLATRAVQCGIDGMVCSRALISEIRAHCAPAVICVPGMSPLGVGYAGQAETSTPRSTLSAGANLVVLGSQFLGAKTPPEHLQEAMTLFVSDHANAAL